MRLRGVFPVLATIAFAQLVESTLYSLLFLDDTTEGGSGGRAFGRPVGFDSPLLYLALLLAAFFAVTAFRRSAMGRALQADLWAPAGARSVGIRPDRGRLVAFVVAATVAGVGGALLSGVGQFVDTFRWNLINAFIWLALVAIGGVGSVWGAFIAAGVFVVTPELVSDVDALNDLYIAGFGVLGLLLLRRPGGLIAKPRQQILSIPAMVGRPRCGATGSGPPALAARPRCEQLHQPFNHKTRSDPMSDPQDAAFSFEMLLSPEFAREPQPIYVRMRDTQPVIREEFNFLGDEGGTVLLSRHEDCELALRNPKTFSSAFGVGAQALATITL